MKHVKNYVLSFARQVIWAGLTSSNFLTAAILILFRAYEFGGS